MNYILRWKFTNRSNDSAWKEYVGLYKFDINRIFQHLAREVGSFTSSAPGVYDFDVIMIEGKQ